MGKMLAILWHELLHFKKNWLAISLGSLISPALYLTVFGWGVGRSFYDGAPHAQGYTNFVIPGIIALTTMTSAFTAVATPLNISRVIQKTFEEFLLAPLPVSRLVLGKITGGALRGFYTGLLMLPLLGLFRLPLTITPLFLLLMFLNAFVFAALGFNAALIINSHGNINKFSSFVIQPMAFLSGTFFPVERFPSFLKLLIYFLPLSHAARGLRLEAGGQESSLWPLLILLGYAFLLYGSAVLLCRRVE